MFLISNQSNFENKKKEEEDEKMCLRPEGTAPAMRALLNNQILWNKSLPCKIFYHGPMFRRERPQLGRQRQFNQFGVELVSNSNLNFDHSLSSHFQLDAQQKKEIKKGAEEDLQIISLAHFLLQRLSVKARLSLNTLAQSQTRIKFQSVLKNYFDNNFSQLSFQSRSNFERKNYLRILDSKIEDDLPIIQSAPKITDHLDRKINLFSFFFLLIFFQSNFRVVVRNS